MSRLNDDVIAYIGRSIVNAQAQLDYWQGILHHPGDIDDQTWDFINICVERDKVMDKFCESFRKSSEVVNE